MLLERELIVDLFAGGGGASEGIEQALGLTVDIAVNHDPDAIAMHLANHPGTKHYVEDVFKVNPLEVVSGRPVGLLWASPDCTHFSRAKGGKPVKKEIRSLAWVVVHWAQLVRPRVIILENVPEFRTWGPLLADDRPDPTKAGQTFNLWVNQLRGLGYEVDFKELSACDYGAPTIRKRLFMIARCDGQSIIWPEPTHGKLFRLKPYRTAAECIDWSIPCPSIFDRQKPLAEATLKRIAKGLRKFVIESGDPFILKFYGGVVGSEITKPLPTVTAIDHNALVMPYLTKYHGARPDMDIDARGQTLHHPLKTQDTSNRFALVSAFLTKFYGTNIGSDMRKPLPTITGGGQHIGEVRAFLVKYYGCGCGQSVKDPMHTITSKDRLGLVTVAGQKYQIADIGLECSSRMNWRKPRDFPTVTNSSAQSPVRLQKSEIPCVPLWLKPLSLRMLN